MIPSVRLASHEIDELVKARSKEARLKRLHQVREQSSQFAKKIRDARDTKKAKVMAVMEKEIKSKVDSEVRVMVEELEEQVNNCLEEFGSAHLKAEKENQINYEVIHQQEIAKIRRKAEHLGKEALKDLKIQKQCTAIEQNKRVLLRKQALDTEAVRSAYIASLPPVKVVAPPVAKKEEPPKVMRFDKSTLFQTEYVIKEKICEVIENPKDARQAATLAEIERIEEMREMEEKRHENKKKMIKRGKEALARQKSHSNYLRLLEELDKMEKEPNKNWDIDSTLTYTEQSLASSACSASPSCSSSEISVSTDDKVECCPTFAVLQPTSSVVKEVPVVPKMLNCESVPVRNCPVQKPSFLPPPPPPLSEKDFKQLNEIGQLLNELKKEQERVIATDQINFAKSQSVAKPIVSKAAQLPTKPTRNFPIQEKSSSSSTSSTSGTSSDGVVVFEDDDVEVRFNVGEKSDSSESQKRKNLANILNAIRKERSQLDSVLQSSQPIKRPGILRRPASFPDSCATSTPVSESGTKQEGDYRKQVLKHYIAKLLEMKRQDVKELSVGSSCVSSSSTSTPKSLSVPTYCAAPTTPEAAHWSRRSDSSSSAYDSPATQQSSSKVSNSSSLPLGVEASSYRRSDTGKGDSTGLFSLGPLLDVYKDVYQAYNQGLRLMAEDRRARFQIPPWQETATESSFMSLTLSAASSERSAVTKQPISGFPGDRSSFSVELSLSSSSSSGGSSRPVSVRDWEKYSFKSELCSSSSSSNSSTVTDLKISNASSTSSQDISMPDVDEALRRLGLPSMQSVLRR